MATASATSTTSTTAPATIASATTAKHVNKVVDGTPYEYRFHHGTHALAVHGRKKAVRPAPFFLHYKGPTWTWSRGIGCLRLCRFIACLQSALLP